MTKYVQAKVESIERPITSWLILGIIATLIMTYACLINATIINIVAAKDMQSRAGTLTTTVSDLESRYLAAQSSYGLDYAMAQGFVEPRSDATQFLSVRAASSLSFNR